MNQITKWYLLWVVALFANVGTLLSTSIAASNSSNVNLEMTYNFAGAVFTDSGLPATPDFDYEFDGEPGHFFGSFGTFVYSLGDGTSSHSGSAMIGDVSYNFPDESPDFPLFDPFTDSATINLSTMGESSTPGSNGSAAIQSDFYLSYYNFTSDPNNNFDTESLTFIFDYSYTFSMLLIEDAPTGGQGNGFITIEAELEEDNSNTFYPDLIQEYYGGPANLSGLTGSGQLMFVTTPGESYGTMYIYTNVNSTTLVDTPVPEPASVILCISGLVAGCLYFRRVR